MKTRLSVLIIIFILFFSFSRFNTFSPGELAPVEKYSTVKVFVHSAEDLKRLQQNDITVEHFHGNYTEGITLVINQLEIERLKSTGMQYSIEIPDMDLYYKNRPLPG